MIYDKIRVFQIEGLSLCLVYFALYLSRKVIENLRHTGKAGLDPWGGPMGWARGLGPCAGPMALGSRSRPE